EPGGGFYLFDDFTQVPVRRWAPNQWELYSFFDENPSSYQPSTYIGRGSILGTVGPSSPLTNVGATMQSAFRDTVADITYLGGSTPSDSLFTLSWSSVPSAVRYWIQIYRITNPPGAIDLMVRNAAAPINLAGTFDHLVASVEAPATTYTLGDFTRSDVNVL